MSVRRPTFRPSLAQVKRANQRAMDLYASCSDRPRFDVGAKPARQPAQSPKPKTVRAPVASEREVKKAICKYLRLSPLVATAYVINGGTAYDSKGQPVRFYYAVKGSPVLTDIVGHLKDGRPYVLELKAEDWKMAGPTAVHAGAERERAQQACIDQCVALGGVGGFVRSVEEARQIVEGRAPCQN